MASIKDGIAASLEAHGWELESAVERNRDDPTFAIPDEHERAHLHKGQRVKLLVLFAEEAAADAAAAEEVLIQCERLWFKVTLVEHHYYVGRLESTPVSSSILKAGELIRFAPEHVAAILIPRVGLGRRILGALRFKDHRGGTRDD